jgi:tRNA-guanine family transglycosylase
MRVLPEDRPKHMLGISEPDDMFAAVEHGVDTLDCVSPTRVGRNGAFYTFEGRKNIRGAMYKEDFTPLLEELPLLYVPEFHPGVYAAFVPRQRAAREYAHVDS